VSTNEQNLTGRRNALEARSRRDAKDIIDELTVKGVKLSIGGSVHDPTDPVGRLIFNVLAMVAEFESDLIRARTREGMLVAKVDGRPFSTADWAMRRSATRMPSTRCGAGRSSHSTRSPATPRREAGRTSTSWYRPIRPKHELMPRSPPEGDSPTIRTLVPGGRSHRPTTTASTSPRAPTRGAGEVGKQYDAGETKPAPWRITCFFVDRDHRRSDWYWRRWTARSS